MQKSIFAIIAILFICGCQPKEETKKSSQQIIPVKVMEVSLKDLNKTLEYVGDIKAEDEAMIYPKVTGKIIEKVKEDGSLVNKGEAVAFIDRDEVGLKFEKAPVISPLTGVIGRVYVDIGSNVSPQTPIALVVKMDKVRIDLDIPEKYLPEVFLNQEAKVSVDAYPDEQFTGRVTKISPVLDLSTRSAPIEITIDNPNQRLKSGMFARVELVIQQHKKVAVILKEAIMGREPQTYVFVVEDKKAVLKKISLGIRQGPYFEVTEGLQEKDQVVIMGQQRLFEGAQVEPEK